MKNYKYISLALIAAFAVNGCSKGFLNVPPQGSITESQALQDPNAADQLVGGIYNTLYLGGFDNTTVGFEWEMLAEVSSDNADKGSTPDDFNTGGAGDIDNFTVDANNGILNNIWNGYYIGIARANKAIQLLDAATFDSTDRFRLEGEARFMRGMYYFNLVRTFGGVVNLTTVPTPQETNLPQYATRASVADIYATITADLQYSVDHLPLKGDPSTQVGRANKGVAEAYLAKVYLYLKNWQKAYDLSSDVISSNLYSLSADYGAQFRQAGNNNAESIFEVQSGTTTLATSVSPLYSNGQGPRGKGGWDDLGFGFNNPTISLIGSYESGDTREAGTIIFITPTNGTLDTGTVLWDGFRIPSQDSVQNSTYNYKAYVSASKEMIQADMNKDTKPKNIKLMRYAEVLLTNAEAAANLGISATADADLNLVRARANLPASTGTIANIWKERRVELAMECDRFFDLVRTGQVGTVMRASGKNFVDGKNEIFPIPQPQIDLSNGTLSQNPGY